MFVDEDLTGAMGMLEEAAKRSQIARENRKITVKSRKEKGLTRHQIFEDYFEELNDVFFEEIPKIEDADTKHKRFMDQIAGVDNATIKKGRTEEENIRYSNEIEDIKAEIRNRYSEIRNDYNAHVWKFYEVSGSKIDKDDLELLRTGIMKADDLKQMSGKYLDNPTMIRIMGKESKDHDFYVWTEQNTKRDKMTDAMKRALDMFGNCISADSSWAKANQRRFAERLEEIKHEVEKIEVKPIRSGEQIKA